jgi:hypothetical protein
MFTLEESALLGRMLRAMGVMAMCAIAGVGYLLVRMHAAPATPIMSAPLPVSSPQTVSAQPAVSSRPALSAGPAASAPDTPRATPAAPPVDRRLDTVRHDDGPAAAPVARPHRVVHAHHLHPARAGHRRAKLIA